MATESAQDEFMNALHIITDNLGDNIDDLKVEDLKEMLTFTKLYYNNRSAFRAKVVAQDYDCKSRNHLIKTVRKGNFVWAKKIIQLLDTLDNFTLESSQFMGKECYICYEPFEENHIVYKVPCNGNHIFHKDCIDKWVTLNSSCPYCRDPIDLDNITGFLNKQSISGKTVLYYAIKLGNLPFVEDLMSKGALVGYNDAAPIHLAAGFSHQELVAYFLAKGVSIESLDGVGRTPLYYGARYGKPNILQYLLENNAKFRFKYYDEDRDEGFESNALLLALRYNNSLESINYLIQYAFEHNISIDEEDSRGKNALHYAILYPNVGLVVTILHFNPNLKKNLDRYHPLITAVSTPLRYEDIFFILLGHMDAAFVEPEERKIFLEFLSLVFTQACQCHKTNYIKSLLEKYHIQIPKECYSALTGSNMYKDLHHLKSYQKLMNNFDFFLACVKCGETSFVENILENNIFLFDEDKEGNTAVHYASSVSMFETLHLYGFDLNAKNNHGDTILHTLLEPVDLSGVNIKPLSYFDNVSLEEDNVDEDEDFIAPPIRRRIIPTPVHPHSNDDDVDDVEPVPIPIKKTVVKKSVYVNKIKYLKEKGIDINALNNDGLSALQIATLNQKYGVIEELLNAGADANECSKYDSPLHIAMKRNYDDHYILLLIDKGADLERFYDDETVAHYALYNKNTTIWNHLVKKGVDLNRYNKNQQTPLGVLLKKEGLPNLTYFVEKGLNVNIPSNFGGNTLEYPLHYATRMGSTLLVKELLHFKADASLRDAAGKNALDYENNPTIRNILLKALGKESQLEPEASEEEEEELEIEFEDDINENGTEVEVFLESNRDILESRTGRILIGRRNGVLVILDT